MTFDLIQTIAAVLSVVVSALGFFFVSRQLRKSAHSDVYALAIATKEAIAERPHLRGYFYDNLPFDVEDKVMRNQILVIADMYSLYLEQIAIYAEDLGGEKDAWLEYIRNMHAASPAIRYYIQEYPYATVLYDSIGIKRTGNVAESKSSV